MPRLLVAMPMLPLEIHVMLTVGASSARHSSRSVKEHEYPVSSFPLSLQFLACETAADGYGTKGVGPL